MSAVGVGRKIEETLNWGLVNNNYYQLFPSPVEKTIRKNKKPYKNVYLYDTG